MVFLGCRRAAALSLVATMLANSAAGQPAATQCTGATECRTQAELAISQGEFERAHDLAWRAVQQGARNDPALMYLLARAQALSYRPDDALVMLRRIAETGIAPDASIDDFRSARELPGWPAVEALIDRFKNRAPEPLPARPPRASSMPRAAITPVAPAASASARAPSGELRRDRAGAASGREGGPAAPAAPATPVAVENSGSFTSPEFLPGGLACDAVSKRYVFGDREGRRVRVLADGSDHAIDLTRAASAGFLDVMALDIDRTNGTLWVVSAEPDGRDATLHRLQLISGRSLSSHRLTANAASARPVDMAVTSAGTVLLLDTEGRLLALRRGAKDVAVLTQLAQEATTSLAISNRYDFAYVAHRDGLSRIDLQTREVSPLRGPGGASVGGIEGLRSYQSGLIGVQSTPDGTRRLVRLALNRSGRSVADLSVLDVPLPDGAAPQVAVCGAHVAVLVREGDAWTFKRLQLGP